MTSKNSIASAEVKGPSPVFWPFSFSTKRIWPPLNIDREYVAQPARQLWNKHQATPISLGGGHSFPKPSTKALAVDRADSRSRSKSRCMNLLLTRNAQIGYETTF